MRVSKPLATTLLLIERSSSLDSSSSEGNVSDQHEFPVEVSAEPKSPRPSSFWNLTPARWLSMQDWIGRADRKPPGRSPQTLSRSLGILLRGFCLLCGFGKSVTVAKCAGGAKIDVYGLRECRLQIIGSRRVQAEGAGFPRMMLASDCASHASRHP